MGEKWTDVKPCYAPGLVALRTCLTISLKTTQFSRLSALRAVVLRHCDPSQNFMST
ncbi:uncharacterized protein BDZ83DRAFT_597314 [Colletotrichum acutatum]|uniref:Uncharacterized protein n=1 Tax=Glomerella acutata TaxID=27357 RepID=A0AAD9D361_GLOAC|nr:uncharacterized protein BDZ83DRAFT_597314 [Colletotrichum acutatum]KAK1731963.1 hypothetical protein BDZ83DRAFT_597314 [Colletotrichum acutatum]